MENTLKKKNILKRVLLGLLVGVLVGGIGTVSYAMFTYNSSSINNKLVVGDIYMRYKENNSINFTNAMPTNNYVANQYFEFQIIGKNTNTTKDIIYDIVLAYGDDHGTRNTRIRDDLLRFRLVTVSNNTETELFTDQSYDSINNTRIHATTIPKNTTSETTTTYRLYAWISGDTVIGNVNQDYTEQQWEDVFASIKVNVTGDFSEKEVARPFSQIIQTTTKDTGIHFYEISSSTNGQGLYMMESTENDTYPIYYYRGNVDNNNVYFAGYCWKIVRTTSTGGLKLVYNGTADTVNGEKQCNQTTGNGTQLSVGTRAFNSSSNSPAYVGYSLPESSKIYSYSTESLNSTTYYGTGVDSTTHKLLNPVQELNDTHHYSYNSTDINATEDANNPGMVRYYYYKSSAEGYYIKFDKTKTISQVLDEMLLESNSKNNPSSIQSTINSWWGSGGDNSLNATYGSYLEDTEWCNDRSIASLGAWAEDGPLYSSKWYDYSIVFNERVRYDQSTFGSNENNIKNTNTPILTCSNPNDRLTVANGNLTYPIGLLTYDELAMAGAIWSNTNTSFYLYTGQSYWLLSPSYCYFPVVYVGLGGNLDYNSVYNSYGVRPALSLKPGTRILRGEGSKTKPYIITE